MTLVSAFLVHGNPLPYLKPDNPPWQALDAAYRQAGKALAESRPDVIAVYSTQWMAVLDQLWQTRPHVQGLHVDENWHEFGDLPFDMRIDTELTDATLSLSGDYGVRSKGVNYDAFPIDTGTIIANNYLNGDGALPLVIASNNLYHDGETTAKLAGSVLGAADKLNRRVALVGVGGLSGTIFREEINIEDDHIASAEDDEWNRKMLEVLCAGDAAEVNAMLPDYAAGARVDMGFKHLAWVLGGMGNRYQGAQLLGYGPVWGSGAAVVQFDLG